jgi:hypothetical protein
MLRKMEARVIFLDPNDMNRGTAELIDNDFEVEYLVEDFDDYGRAAWIICGLECRTLLPMFRIFIISIVVITAAAIATSMLEST